MWYLLVRMFSSPSLCQTAENKGEGPMAFFMMEEKTAKNIGHWY
jgi:hypothetical protein